MKKGELDTRMQTLINSRDQLMERLAQLDILTKPPGQQQQLPLVNGSGSIRVTAAPPATTPGIQPQPSSQQPQPQAHSRSWSTPSTPAAAHYEFHHPNRHVYNQSQQQHHHQPKVPSHQLHPNFGTATSVSSQQTSMMSLTGTSSTTGGSQASIDSGSSSLRVLRNDLLVAADSVTNAMQSLVNELNSENRLGHESLTTSYRNNNGDNNNQRNGNNDSDRDEEDDLDEQPSYRHHLFGRVQNGMNNYPTTSVSASATPVTYRKYHHFGHHLQPNHQTLAASVGSANRNAVNLDDFGIDYLASSSPPTNEINESELRDLSNQILNGFAKTTTTIEAVAGVVVGNEENEEESAAYIESYIEELSKKEGVVMDDVGGGASAEGGAAAAVTAGAASPTDIDLDEVEQNLMLCNLGEEESEQIAEWRRELEQVLTDQQDNNNSNNNNTNKTINESKQHQ